MKSYLYVSKSKLETLIDQLPEPMKQKYKSEVSLGVGLASGKVSAEVEPSIPGRTLGEVSRTICDQYHPGTLQDARKWSLDRMLARHVSVEDNPNLFLLVGKQGGVYHCLGGSRHHVVGNKRGQDVNTGYSYFPYMAQALEREFSEAGIRARDDAEAFFGADKTKSELGGVRTHEWADAIRALYELSTGPEIEVRFLAHFLAYGRCLTRDYCAVWSPLYVEYA